MIWHSNNAEEITAFFDVDKNKGLPTGMADERLQKYGRNIINTGKSVTVKEKIIKCIFSSSNLIVFACAFISLLANIIGNYGEWYYTLFIMLTLFINTAISIFAEISAERKISSLKFRSLPKAKVLRDGIVKKTESSLIVPGDILILEKGDYISADARLIESFDLHCDESFLTGESVSVEKKASDILEDIISVEKRTNMVYYGCSVVSGKGIAVVTETGMNTEIGKKVTLLSEKDSNDTDMKKRLDALGKISGAAIFILTAAVFLISVIANLKSTEPFASVLLDCLMNSAALLISVIPEGLTVMALSALSVSALNLIEKNILVKNLNVFNKLPYVSVVCSDKTGTLTHNKMYVTKIFDGISLSDVTESELSESQITVIKLAALCKGTYDLGQSSPDQTETAIDNFFTEIMPEESAELKNRYPRLCSVPFDSERKRMTSVNMIDGRPIAIVKGAPDSMAEKCGEKYKKIISEITDNLTESAFRVICIAIKPLDEIPTHPSAEDIENNLQFAGLIALYNPPRNEAISFVEECDRSGIRTLMMTGDHTETARSVARRIGILKNDTVVVTGEELSDKDDAELKENINRYSVFSRITPKDKIRIVKALKDIGETVAITGDDVEDAYALSEADVGIAMGNYGTDVARGAADIILDSNNYGSIIACIKESQSLLERIKKAVIYIFSSNIGELLTVLFGLFIFGKFTAVAGQLLLLNLITDTVPVFSLLCSDNRSSKIKRMNINDKRFLPEDYVFIGVQSVVITVISLISYSLYDDIFVARTSLFLVLAFSQLFNLLIIKRPTSLPSFKSLKDWYIPIIIIAEYLLAVILSVTGAGALFGMIPITFTVLVKSVLLSLCVFLSGLITLFGFRIYHKITK